jgi:hypothetical protein
MPHHPRDTARRAQRIAPLIVAALLAAPAGASASSDRPPPQGRQSPSCGQVILAEQPQETAPSRTTPSRNDVTGTLLTLPGIALAGIAIALLIGRKQEAHRSPADNSAIRERTLPRTISRRS